MTATAHALVAGAIVVGIPNPAIGLPLAAASHPFLDLIPHWDLGLNWKKKNKTRLFLESTLDLGLGVTLTYLIFGANANLWYLAGAVFLSESWDLLMMPRLLWGWNFPPFSFFYRVQHDLQVHAKAKLPWGILTQAATVMGVVLILQIFH